MVMAVLIIFPVILHTSHKSHNAVYWSTGSPSLLKIKANINR